MQEHYDKGQVPNVMSILEARKELLLIADRAAETEGVWEHTLVANVDGQALEVAATEGTAKPLQAMLCVH